MLPAYQATTTSNFLEFDELSSIYFCYYLILPINCDPNIFLHRWFTRLKTILPVLIHSSQWIFIKGIHERWDCAVSSAFPTRPPWNANHFQRNTKGSAQRSQFTHSFSYDVTQITPQTSLWQYSDTKNVSECVSCKGIFLFLQLVYLYGVKQNFSRLFSKIICFS